MQILDRLKDNLAYVRELREKVPKGVHLGVIRVQATDLVYTVSVLCANAGKGVTEYHNLSINNRMIPLPHKCIHLAQVLEAVQRAIVWTADNTTVNEE